MFQSLVFGTYIELLGFWFVFECQIPKKVYPRFSHETFTMDFLASDFLQIADPQEILH